jgi:hypothetical protein
MRYFTLSPQVVGGIGPRTVLSRVRHPPIVTCLHYEFDVWPQDDLIEGFPCFIVTPRLAAAIGAAEPTGVTFDGVEATKAGTCEDLHPHEMLPEFVWMQITGTPGVDDFGADALARLVVSERALQVLKTFSLKNCEVTDFEPQ